MRILFTGIAALALAGCQSAAPAGNGAVPNEAAVEASFQNEQTSLAASIEDDANAAESAEEAADANLGADTDGQTAYSCDSGITLTVTYTEDGNASLTTGGRTLALKAVPATSGTRFHADAGLAPGKTLTWWSKGNSAMLIQAPRGAKGGAGETTANCLATDPDQ